MQRLSIETAGAKTKALYRVPMDGAEDIFVKVHAIKHARAFGKVGWTMTGSHCLEDGKAIPEGEGFRIHCDAYQVIVQSHSPANVAECFEAGLLVIVGRVRNAVEIESASTLETT